MALSGLLQLLDGADIHLLAYFVQALDQIGIGGDAQLSGLLDQQLLIDQVAQGVFLALLDLALRELLLFRVECNLLPIAAQLGASDDRIVNPRNDLLDHIVFFRVFLRRIRRRRVCLRRTRPTGLRRIVLLRTLHVGLRRTVLRRAWPARLRCVVLRCACPARRQCIFLLRVGLLRLLLLGVVLLGNALLGKRRESEQKRNEYRQYKLLHVDPGGGAIRPAKQAESRMIYSARQPKTIL